jgi:hypothetical protein
MSKLMTALLATMILLTACAATPDTPVDDNPAVQPTKEPLLMPDLPVLDGPNANRESIFIEEKGLLIRESFPPQIALGLSGNLPTPCHQLQADIDPPDAENKINIDVYSVADPAKLCTQVLQPFSETLELGTFPSGHYSVWLNGELVGEFDS